MSFSRNITPYQLYKPRNLDGLLESNKLSNAFLTQPVEMAGVIAYAFGTDSRSGKNGNIMNLLTEGLGNVTSIEIDNAVYKWKLYMGGERMIDVAGQNLDGGSTPGIAKTPFRVPVAENFFEDGDVVLLDDGKTRLRVQGDATTDGTSTVHTFRLIGGDQSSYVDPKLVGPGARMSKEYNVQPELSTRGSGISLHTGIELDNRLGTFRKTIAISRGAQTDVMAMKIPVYGPDGKPTMKDVWDTAATWQATYEFAQEIDRAMIYGQRQEGDILGANGRGIYEGSGFREQISPNNVWEVNKLTYNTIQELFTNLSYNANKNGGNKKFVVLTGQQGMIEINRILTEEFKGRGYLLTDSNKFLGGSGNELELKGHFSKVQLMNDLEVSWKLFPEYDNSSRNRNYDPKSGYPLESFRQTILNVGTQSDGKGNIQKVVKKDSEKVAWEVGGSVTAAGTRKGGAQGASGLDGREMHWLSECGIRLADPTSCAEIVRVAA